MNSRFYLPYNLSMTEEADELLKKALTLSPEDRATLAGSLLESLEEAEEGVEEAWNEEITRRVEEFEAGKAKTVSWDEVRRYIEAKLNGQ
jgi:putative addiction module component (TIGR02574 family)